MQVRVVAAYVYIDAMFGEELTNYRVFAELRIRAERAAVKEEFDKCLHHIQNALTKPSIEVAAAATAVHGGVSDTNGTEPLLVSVLLLPELSLSVLSSVHSAISPAVAPSVLQLLVPMVAERSVLHTRVRLCLKSMLVAL